MRKILHVSVHPSPGETVVSAEGEIDLSVIGSFRQSLQEAIATNPAGMVLDLSRVTYMDSTGIYAILDAWRSLGKEAGRLRIRTVFPATTRILELAGLGRLIEDRPSASVTVSV